MKSYPNGNDGERKGFSKRNFTGKLSEVVSPEIQKQIAAKVAAYGPEIDALKKKIDAFDKQLVAKFEGGQKDDYGYESNRVFIVRKAAGKLVGQGEASNI